MKLFHTIATAAMLFIASTAAFAQPSVSLSLNNTSIERALDRIEDQSGYNFLIADKSLDLSKRVDVAYTGSGPTVCRNEYRLQN